MPNDEGVMEAVTILRSSDFAYPAVFRFACIYNRLCNERGADHLGALLRDLSARRTRPWCHLQHRHELVVNAIVGMTFLTLINTFGPGSTFCCTAA